MPVDILLIEDAEPDVFLVREALRQAGLSVNMTVLADGEKAFEFIERVDRDATSLCPKLVLLDLNLPKRSGDQILQRIRQSLRLGDVPVIVVTSSDAPEDRAMATKLGATGYLRKSSKLDEFMKLGGLVRGFLEPTSGTV